MDILRTPDSCFDNIKDYAFSPNYCDINVTENQTARMHYVDENSQSDEVFLLLHGEPSWSYLYRHMIPILAKTGKRVIAPDLIGFGKSDKLGSQSDYTYENHVRWMSSFINHLDLNNITFFGQDWGGLIGLRIVAQDPSKFSGMLLANTMLPIGKGASEGFEAWKKYSQTVEDFNSGKIVNNASLKKLSDDEIAAYNAPFPDDSYKACARQFPNLVPLYPDDASVPENIAAWEILKKFDKPTLTIFGLKDPVTLGGEKIFQKLIPGCKDLKHEVVEAAHFIQEDQPELLAQGLINLYN